MPLKHGNAHMRAIKRVASACTMRTAVRGLSQKVSPDPLVQHRAMLRKFRLPSAPLLDRRLPVDFHAAGGMVPAARLLDNARIRVLTLQGDGSAKRDDALSNGLLAFGARLPALDETMDFEALLLDARALRHPSHLDQLHTCAHPILKYIKDTPSLRRVLVLGLQPQHTQHIEQSVCAGALEGFVRSLAKELGPNGASANLLQASPNGAVPLGPTSFFLSNRSAFITGQSIAVSNVMENADATPADPPRATVRNKLIVVTGAAQGIGEATARLLVAEGADVILLDHPSQGAVLGTCTASLGRKAHGVTADITSPSAATTLAAKIMEIGGGRKLDAIVHNAGITADKTLGRMTFDAFDRVIRVNLEAVMNINAEFIEQGILGAGSKVVCLSSTNGIAGAFGQTNYATSKAGLVEYVKFAAQQYTPKHGIHFNAVAPGFIETRMTAKIPFVARNIGRRSNAFFQPGYPVDVAEALMFLSSPLSEGVNGVTLRVCGALVSGR